MPRGSYWSSTRSSSGAWSSRIEIATTAFGFVGHCVEFHALAARGAEDGADDGEPVADRQQRFLDRLFQASSVGVPVFGSPGDEFPADCRLGVSCLEKQVQQDAHLGRRVFAQGVETTKHPNPSAFGRFSDREKTIHPV